MSMNVKFHTGTESDIYRDAVMLRKQIFVEEQGIELHREMDDLDGESVHFVAYVAGVPVGTARIYSVEGVGAGDSASVSTGDGAESDSAAKLGRVAVAKAFRHQGIALAMCRFCVEYAREQGFSQVYVNAQTYISSLYAALGFSVCGEEFLEEGIPHLKMALSLCGAG